MNERFSEELTIGEELLWTGQPLPWIFFSPVDLLLIPVSIVLGGIAIESGMKVLYRFFYSDSSGVDAMTALGYVPLILVGFYLVLGRLAYKWWKKRHTYYALTNKRILVLSTSPRRHLMHEFISQIPEMHKSANSNGIGTITFARSPFIAAWCGNTGINCSAGFTQQDYMAFHDIQDAEKVYGMLLQVRPELADEGIEPPALNQD